MKSSSKPGFILFVPLSQNCKQYHHSCEWLKTCSSPKVIVKLHWKAILLKVWSKYKFTTKGCSKMNLTFESSRFFTYMIRQLRGRWHLPRSSPTPEILTSKKYKWVNNHTDCLSVHIWKKTKQGNWDLHSKFVLCWVSICTIILYSQFTRSLAALE